MEGVWVVVLGAVESFLEEVGGSIEGSAPLKVVDFWGDRA